MTHLENMPLWLALPIAFFLVAGATLTLLGTIGFVQLKSFYDRLHAPTLGTSWGAAGILLASMLLASWIEGRAVLHELVIGVFLMITTPVTLMLLGRAGLHRDRAEGLDVPPPLSVRDPEPETIILQDEADTPPEASPTAQP